MPVDEKRIIGRPAKKLSREREIAFRKAVRETLAVTPGNGRSSRSSGAADHCTRSLAEHLKPFSGTSHRLHKAAAKP
jgi:hypothetical protein